MTASMPAGGVATGRFAVFAPPRGASRGQVLIMVAILLPVLLAFVALVLDTGHVWISRRYLQNAVDAAALAGAQELPEETALARAIACDYATVKNAVADMDLDCASTDITISQTYVVNDTITVTARRSLSSFFGVFGLPDVTVSADATVVVGSLHTLCVFPLFQTQDRLQASGAWAGTPPDLVQFNVPTIMKTSADDSNSGNFLYLEANGSGSKDAIRDAIGTPGGCAQQSTDTAQTATGNAVGPLDQGMEQRRSHYMDPYSPGYCPDPSPTFDNGTAVHAAGHPLAGEALTPDNCYRMVQFPLMEGVAADYNGTQSGPVEGYLTFYISNWCGQNSDPKKGKPDAQHCPAPAGTTLPPLGWGELWGYYLKYEAVTDNPTVPYDGLGTKVMVMID